MNATLDGLRLSLSEDFESDAIPTATINRSRYVRPTRSDVGSVIIGYPPLWKRVRKRNRRSSSITSAKASLVLVGAQSECSVCLSDFVVKEDLPAQKTADEVSILPCKHLFHTLCLSSWIKTSAKRTCPLCRGAF